MALVFGWIYNFDKYIMIHYACAQGKKPLI